jgi:predicted PurR-regulated permease PerM
VKLQETESANGHTEEPTSSSDTSSAARLRRIILVVIAVGVSVLFLWMIQRFIMALFLAAILAGLFHPIYRLLDRRFHGRKQLASMITLLIVLLLVVLPALALLGLVAAQGYQLAQAARPWVEAQMQRGSGIEESLQSLPYYEYVSPYRDEILQKMADFVSRLGGFVVGALTAVAARTVALLLSLFVMLYAMYFFLIGGHALLRRILYYLPLPSADEDQMVDRFLSVTRATLKGTLVIGILQGVLAGLAFWIAGIEGAAFWGTMMAVLSVIPGLGPTIVWLPAVIYLLVVGRVGAGIALFVWCAGIVSTIDNLLRPRLVGRDTKMPDLLILLSTLGGIIAFGAIGFIVGPIVAAVFVTAWELYGSAFRGMLPD